VSDKLERATQATHLLDGSLFAESMAKLEASLIQQWRDAKTVQEREECHARILAIDSFKADMRDVITTGEIAAKEEGLSTWRQQ
jgi:hypothetical protein